MSNSMTRGGKGAAEDGELMKYHCGVQSLVAQNALGEVCSASRMHLTFQLLSNDATHVLRMRKRGGRLLFLGTTFRMFFAILRAGAQRRYCAYSRTRRLQPPNEIRCEKNAEKKRTELVSCAQKKNQLGTWWLSKKKKSPARPLADPFLELALSALLCRDAIALVTWRH